MYATQVCLILCVFIMFFDSLEFHFELENNYSIG